MAEAGAGVHALHELPMLGGLGIAEARVLAHASPVIRPALGALRPEMLPPAGDPGGGHALPGFRRRGEQVTVGTKSKGPPLTARLRPPAGLGLGGHHVTRGSWPSVPHPEPLVTPEKRALLPPPGHRQWLPGALVQFTRHDGGCEPIHSGLEHEAPTTVRGPSVPPWGLQRSSGLGGAPCRGSGQPGGHREPAVFTERAHVWGKQGLGR